jgi:hypothetical protein
MEFLEQWVLVVEVAEHLVELLQIVMEATVVPVSSSSLILHKTPRLTFLVV